jgi:hypothetical protein
LRLVPGLVDLALVIDFLLNVELDFHLRLLRTPAVATNFSPVFVIVFRICDSRIWQLNMGNLKVILRVTGSMCADKKTVG